MVFDDIKIDLLFARLNPQDFETNKSVKDFEELAMKKTFAWQRLDQQSQSSFGGTHVVLQILNVIPNEQVFRETLQFVKFWAFRRNIYSNILGYLGGVSLAIMVARVCQEYKDVTELSEMVYLFFNFIADWKWPQALGIFTESLNLSSLK